MTATEVNVEHGTRAAYRAGCHCPECRKANSAATAQSRRSPRGYVAAGKVRTHIELLHDDGTSYREIARRAGVDARTVQRIAVGEIDSCTAANRTRILSVLPTCGTGYINHNDGIREEDLGDGEDFGPPVPDDPLASLRLLITDPAELAWKADGECARLDITVEKRHQWFFPLRGDSIAPALTICSRCPVWAPCLQAALDWNCDGIWGRSSGAARRKLVHLGISVGELAAAGMADDPSLSVTDAIDRVLAAREVA